MSGNNESVLKWLTGALTPVVFGPPHHATHLGNSYLGGFLSSGTASGATAELLMITRNSEINLRFAVHSGGDAYVVLIEAPTVISSGTYNPVINRNRNSLNTPDMLMFRGPSVSGGTEFPTMFIPGGSGGLAAGGMVSFDDEILLKKNSVYSLRAKNITAQAQDICILVDSYIEVGEPASD